MPATTAQTTIAVIGIDIGKNSFHIVGLDRHGAIVLRQKWSRSQVEARFANILPCLIGMEACVGSHHLSRKLKAFGHDARLMPAKYVRPYSKGQKNDFRDTGAIAEAVQRPTMKFAARCAVAPHGRRPAGIGRYGQILLQKSAMVDPWNGSRDRLELIAAHSPLARDGLPSNSALLMQMTRPAASAKFINFSPMR